MPLITSAAQLEHRHDFPVGDEVQVALPVAGLGVPQPVVLLRERAHTLGEDAHPLGVDGDFAGAGADEAALHAQVIADVQVLEQLEVVAHVVAAEQDLNTAGSVLQVQERRAPHYAHGNDAARQRHALGILGRATPGLNGLEGGGRGGIVAGAVEARGIRVDAVAAQPLQLDGPVGQKALFPVSR